MTTVQRWTFAVPTALGVTQSSFEITDDALLFESDDLMSGGNETLRWASIRQGATAAMAGMGGRGMPDLPNWIPSQLEWLLLSRTEGGGRAFMRVLPEGEDRDAIVAALQARLGAGWIGTRLPLKVAQSRLGITEGTWGTVKVIGIVLAVMALLVLLIMALGLLLHPLVTIPAGFALGGWLCRRGLGGLRDGLAVANTPTAKVGSAAIGLVELVGRAVGADVSAAGVTGQPSLWWDVSVYVEYEDGDRNREWRQVASRHGGSVDLVEIEDSSARLPIWLPGATLLLGARRWASRKAVLPTPGLLLLDQLGFHWSGARQIRVTEESFGVNQTLYVLGTLDERRNLPGLSEAGLLDRVLQSIRSGQWHRAVVGAVPTPLRIVVAVAIGYLDMLVKIGHGNDRRARDIVTKPPALPAHSLVVWKGRNGRPFLVSNQPESTALANLRRRSLWTFGAGGAVLCFTLYQFVQLFTGK